MINKEIINVFRKNLIVELVLCIINIYLLLRIYLCDWLNFSILMYRSSVIRDVLMLLVFFSRFFIF